MATTTTKRAKESLPPGEPDAEKPANSDDLMERIAALEARVAELEDMPARDVEDRLAMVVFSGNMDRAIAAFIIATGAVAMGLETSIFFTFWGLSVIKKQKRYVGKNFLQRAFTAMLPAGTTRHPITDRGSPPARVPTSVASVSAAEAARAPTAATASRVAFAPDTRVERKAARANTPPFASTWIASRPPALATTLPVRRALASAPSFEKLTATTK